MHVSKNLTALLATILTTGVVSASPVASDTGADLAKRTPGNIYVCKALNWGSTCAVISVGTNTCTTLPSTWKNQIGSLGPDAGATCYAYTGTTCSGTMWTFSYPGDATGGWATSSPWQNNIASIYCDTTGGGPPSGGGGGGGTSHTGIATYYYPNGGLGSCGWAIQNSDFAVALNPTDAAGGAHCGQTATVTYGSTTIHVVVADLCPGCQGAHGIDLTQGAMAALDPNWYNDGEVTVTWSV
ncbi:hypothetical protein B0H14DRAFT_2440751 [Mycena olivaceomarginata]|nr:hypothetical protein B0H14DRAFT_2440751 [Mycena olivaceomarginata]